MANVARVSGPRGYDLPPDQVIFGTTSRMKEICDKLDKLARTNIPLLIRGESGTGKKVVAQLIHRKSHMNAGRFVEVTCSEASQTPFEKNVFGDEKGTAGGVDDSKPQIMELAANGTLFLDEIGDLSKALQAKLLRKFQEGQFGFAEGYGLAHGDTRILCATNRNLEQAMKYGSFRPDLFYRINVASLDLPPLRERSADVAVLVQYFLERFSAEFNCLVKPISPATMRSLEQYSWPGNIRELENVIKRYVIVGSESTLCDGLRTGPTCSASSALRPGPRLEQGHKTGMAGMQDHVRPQVVEDAPCIPAKGVKQ